MTGHYDWVGGREAMMRLGPADGPVVIAALPLFEEANRTRAFAVTVLRALAAHGIGGALPDLPGQGDSLLPTERASLPALRSAFAAAVASLSGPAFTLAIRSGALLDAAANVQGRCHLAPQQGRDLVRELGRIGQAAARESGTDFDAATLGSTLSAPPVQIAGNLIAPSLAAELQAASPAMEGVRTIRLAGDPKPADAHLPGSPLWRRAEPDNDPAFAALLADDIAAWIAACVG